MPEFTCPVCGKKMLITEAQQRFAEQVHLQMACSLTCALLRVAQMDAGVIPPDPPLDKSKLH